MVKTCPVCHAAFPTKSALASHMTSHQTGRRRGGRGATVSSNVTTLALEEYWGTSAGTTVKHLKFLPGASSLSRLDALGSIYEQYRIRTLVIRLAPIVGMNTSGAVVAGWHYDYNRQPGNYSEIAMCSPHASGPVWSAMTLTVPPRVVMRQSWYATHQAGSDIADSVAGGLSVVTTGGNYSTSVWCRYVVDFQGPTLAKSVSDYLYVYDKKQARWTDEKGAVVTELPATSGNYSIDLEIDGGVSLLNQAWQALQSAFVQAQELHRIGVETLYYARYVASGVLHLVLPHLNTDAVVHVHPDPFRLAIRLFLAGRDSDLASRGSRAAGGSGRTEPADSGAESLLGIGEGAGGSLPPAPGPSHEDYCYLEVSGSEAPDRA